jgi:glycosyltransferase involved in cell wall biosynthesis
MVKGGDYRNWQHLNTLTDCARVGIFGICSNDTRRGNAPDLPLLCWEASTDPALALPPPHGMRLAGRAWLLDPEGHPSDLFFSDHAAQELTALVERLRVAIVVLEGLWLHRYLEVVRRSGCQVILDCHNVEAQLAEDLAATCTGEDLESRVRREVLPERTSAIERRAARSVDQLWACSPEDERRLRRRYDRVGPIVVVPNALRLEDYETVAGPSRRSCPTLIFPAFFGHLPNVLAARFLVEEVLPRVAQACGDCRLRLVGAMPPRELVQAAESDRRVLVTGAVADVRPYLRDATAMVVPIFQGSGTRFKLLEAFAAELPVVSTAKGAEGLGLEHGTHLLIAETADDFAAAVQELAGAPALAAALATRARALVAERFSWPALRARVCDALAQLEN